MVGNWYDAAAPSKMSVRLARLGTPLSDTELSVASGLASSRPTVVTALPVKVTRPVNRFCMPGDRSMVVPVGPAVRLTWPAPGSA